MPAPAQPRLEPGRVYRTRDLATWGANPTRLAGRLLREGRLRLLAQGLFYAPKSSRFGPVPPEDEEILRAFLGSDEFVLTGPPYWNALGLGTTVAFPVVLVYNTRRSGEFTFGRRRYRLRRVRFPRQPTAEWYVIDLLEHREMAGVSRRQLARALATALRRGRFDPRSLRRMAREYGRRKTRDLVESAIGGSPARRALLEAHHQTSPMFWGERFSLDQSCEIIRAWLRGGGRVSEITDPSVLPR